MTWKQKQESHEKIRPGVDLLATIFFLVPFLLHVVGARISSLGWMRIIIALRHVHVIKASFALGIANLIVTTGIMIKNSRFLRGR
jgi:hypothetical protein